MDGMDRCRRCGYLRNYRDLTNGLCNDRPCKAGEARREFLEAVKTRRIIFPKPETKIMRAKPISDRILVRRAEPKDKTEGGIYLPDQAKEKPVRGEVLGVGLGRFDDAGALLPMQVVEGQEVLFGRYAGTDVS